MDKKNIEINDLIFTEHTGNVYRFLVESLEKPLLERALELARGNQLEASRLLGINRNTLREKLRKFGIRR